VERNQVTQIGRSKTIEKLKRQESDLISDTVSHRKPVKSSEKER